MAKTERDIQRRLVEINRELKNNKLEELLKEKLELMQKTGSVVVTSREQKKKE